MTREKSPSQTLLDDIVKRAVTSVLKRIGFRKSAVNFHRRHNDVVQVVNLDDAWKEIHDLCTLFADRQNACRPLWIENLGLRELAARMEPDKSG